MYVCMTFGSLGDENANNDAKWHTRHSHGAHEDDLPAPLQACNEVAEADGFKELVRDEHSQQGGHLQKFSKVKTAVISSWYTW